MKQRSQLAALLLALCLLASLTVVPAAAESLSELESAVTAAQSELDTAKTALSNAQQELNTANASVREAEDAVKSAEAKEAELQEAYKQAVEALLDAEEDADLGDLEAKKEEAQLQWEDAKDAVSDAESKLEAAKTAAGVAEKRSAVDAAQTVVNEKQQALSAAQAALKAEKDKQEAEANKPSVPTSAPDSSDLSYPSSVDFGSLEKGASSSSRTKTFTLKNSSDYELRLSCSTPSGYSVSGFPRSLASGDSATVTVQLDSASRTGNYDARLTITASFTDGDDSNEFSIRLYAEVVEKGYTITVDPTSKDLGKLKEGYTEAEAKEKEVTVIVENEGASSVRMDGVKGNDHFTVTAVRDEYETLENGDTARYKIAPKRGLDVGTYTDTITFQTRENATASFKATVVIEKKVDPLTLEPATLDFGTVEEGYAALSPKTVTVKNNTDYAIRLEQPSSYSYEISLLGQTALSAGSSATFSIRPRTGLPANLYDGAVEIYGYSGDSAQSVRLTMKFTVNRPAGPSTFSDVAAGSTFADDIAYVSQNGLMQGKGEGAFKPQDPVTRGQLVTILYRLENQPAVSGAGFSDVAAGSYCEKAVKWAAANNIVLGGADGLFRPSDPVTRQQLATFLYRYNNYKGYMVAKQADLSTFADGDTVASYAKDALSWANGTGLVNGSNGRLNPSGGATRGQAAAILHRFCVSVGK